MIRTLVTKHPLRRPSATTLSKASSWPPRHWPASLRAASTVRLNISGQDHDLSSRLLRDLCDCERCVHVDTKQRLYSAADTPSHLEPTVTQSKDSVHSTWDADHTTVLPSRVLEQLLSGKAIPGPYENPLPSQSMWSKADFSSLGPDFAYRPYIEDDKTLYDLLFQLRTHGLAFVTDVPGHTTSVHNIANRIGPVKDTLYGLTWDVKSKPPAEAINAAYTSQDLGFHTDLLYTHDPPHIQLLHCVQSSSIGGASTFVDAFKAANDLWRQDFDAFETLATIMVNFHYSHSDSNLYHTRKPTFELRSLESDGRTYPTLRAFHEAAGHVDISDYLEKVSWGPPFMAPFSMYPPKAGSQYSLKRLSEDIEEWHSAANKFSKLLHDPSNVFERTMNPGDCVLFDNTRVLHGRKAFDARDAGTSRWLRGTYVDKDPYLSKLRVLGNAFAMSS